MKPSLFRYGLMTVGVTAALGISASAMANTSTGTTTTDVLIKKHSDSEL
ncbi:hypothetical protein [Psychrobacter sp. Rd 27.2]|nr:hypothetical protein [Psychrobacter sp. Rd 27.2]